MGEFLDLESEHGGSVCWPNNKIIDTSIETGLTIARAKRKMNSVVGLPTMITHLLPGHVGHASLAR